MEPAARSTRPLWIAIAVLAAALAVALFFLARGDASPPAADASASPAADASAPPDEPEAQARTRLLRVSQALDLYFRGRYEFPDRLEVLIAQDLLRPADLDDPWRRPIDYTRVAKARFKLCSRGPDATSFTDDDVCIGPGGRTERPGR